MKAKTTIYFTVSKVKRGCENQYNIYCWF